MLVLEQKDSARRMVQTELGGHRGQQENVVFSRTIHNMTDFAVAITLSK